MSVELVSSYVDAVKGVPVLVARPGRTSVTARLRYLPGPNPRRRNGGRAKVELPSGAFLTVPVESLTMLPNE